MASTTASGAAAADGGDSGALDSYQGIYAGVTTAMVDEWIDALL
jgi:hypothetical protein